jgi:hypothetical protein
MSKHAIDLLWVPIVAVGVVFAVFDSHINVVVKYIPTVATFLVGMLLTDALAIEQSGICPMRYRLAIERSAEPLAFRQQLRIQYLTLIVFLVAGLGTQATILFY